MAVGPNDTKENDKSVNKDRPPPPEPQPITDKEIIKPINDGLNELNKR